MHRSIRRAVLASLFLPLLALQSCCAFCEGPVPTRRDAIAEITLILDVHPDSRPQFRAMSETQRHLSVERAWRSARDLLHPDAYRHLGKYRVPLAADGYPSMVGIHELAQWFYTSAHIAGEVDDPPTGCQFDTENEPPRSIKCDYLMRQVLVPASGDLQEVRYNLGFAVHTRFLDPELVVGA